MEKIVEKDTLFFDNVQELKRYDIKTYLYGAGTAANNLAILLNRKGISIDGMAVDNAYYTSDLADKGVYCLDELLNRAVGKINLIQASAKINKRIIYENENKIKYFLRYDIFHPAHLSQDNIFMSYEWVRKHENDLDKTYDLLEDNISKDIFASYINQRISGDFCYLKDKFSKGGVRQYFDMHVMPLYEGETLIDCGAYIGDTAISFLDELHDRKIFTYSKIYSFEPDAENFRKMVKQNLLNHVCIPKGVSNKLEVLAFVSGKGVGSAIGVGEDFVETDTIDHVLDGEKATIIKMDIEGAELKALIGAANTIKMHKPKLAICIYHKDEDLFAIPQYIKSLVPEYKLFIRIYEEYVNELVLYAIP